MTIDKNSGREVATCPSTSDNVETELVALMWDTKAETWEPSDCGWRAKRRTPRHSGISTITADRQAMTLDVTTPALSTVATCATHSTTPPDGYAIAPD